MDAPVPTAKDTGTSATPRKIPVPYVLEFSTRSNVSYEDVLAARVFEKALRAQSYVLGLILVLLAYVGFDLKGKSDAIRAEQKKLATEQSQLHTEMDQAREKMHDYETQMRDRVQQADEMVKASDKIVQATGAYQGALATHLVSVGHMQSSTEGMQQHTEELQARNDVATKQLTDGLGMLNRSLTMLSEQRRQDSIASERLRQNLQSDVSSSIQRMSSIAEGLSNTWVQVVEEDTPTPVGASGFTFQFDDIKQQGRVVTTAELRFAKTNVNGWPQEWLSVGSPVPVEVKGQKYRLTVLPGESRRRGLEIAQRVVVQIERLNASTRREEPGRSTSKP